MPLPPHIFLSSRAVSALKQSLQHPAKPKLRTDASLVLLCGASGSDQRKLPVRDILMAYARKHFDGFRFFRAEEVLAALKGNTNTDFLTLEDGMADYSDCILVVCESESAFAELGAFTLSERLVKQVLVVNDTRFRRSASFINQGPIARANRKSRFKPAIFADFEAVLSSAVEIENRLQIIKRSNRLGVDLKTGDALKKTRAKYRLLFIADLIHFLFPTTLAELRTLLHFLYPGGYPDIAMEVALLCGLRFVHSDPEGWLFYAKDETRFFYDYPDLDPISVRSSAFRFYFQRDRDRCERLHRRST
jgi:hypothetical protein